MRITKLLFVNKLSKHLKLGLDLGVCLASSVAMSTANNPKYYDGLYARGV